MRHGGAPFSAAWLRRETSALALLPDGFRDPAARKAAVAAAAERRIPSVVLEALIEQNPLPSSATTGSDAVSPEAAERSADRAVDRSLRRLAEPGTVVVVTGQQMGLFLGPLFTLYKAASAVAVVRALEEETGRPVVPLFWLQTEDHDLPEIDHCVLPTGEDPPPTLRLPVPAAGDPATSRCPVGALELGAGVVDVLTHMGSALGHHPHADEHLALLERTYRPDATLAGAFSGLLRSLFADCGLVVLDPRRPALADLARPFYRRALDEAAAISAALEARAGAIESAGFDVQVRVRPGSPLCFFSPEGVAGPRYRLDPAGEGSWTTVGDQPQALPHATLLEHLEREPLRFTTSALLRPLLQDTWLPTAAYVGGPGELNYFAQLPPLYAHLGLSMPLVVPRARFRLLDDRAHGLLEKLALSPEEACAPVDDVLALLAGRRGPGEHPAPDQIAESLLGALEGPLSTFATHAASLDPSLKKSVEVAERAIRDAIERAVAKYGRVLARRDEVTVERVRRVSSLLAPGGVPQERVYGLSYFACRYGARALVSRLLAEVQPFDPALKDLSP